jgi:hypothetical protein
LIANVTANWQHDAGGPQWMWWALWIGLALLTISLLVLMKTRWGQTQPLGKCLALSLLAHLLLAGYATSVQIVNTTFRGGADHVVRVSEVAGVDNAAPEAQDAATDSEPTAAKPWDLVATAAELPELPEPEPRAEPLPANKPLADVPPDPAPPLAAPLGAPPGPMSVANERPLVERLLADTSSEPVSPPAAAAMDEAPSGPTARSESSPMAERPLPLTPPAPLEDLIDVTPADSALDALAPPLDAPAPELPPEVIHDSAPTPPAESLAGSATDKPTLDPLLDPAPPVAVPLAYSQRMERNADLARQNGGGAETEGAVDLALRWLVANQEANGRWSAARHGAGHEMKVGGEDRRGAGADADNGVTGLALLALLGAGHTQLQGEHSESVRRGLEYLLASQSADGCLAGKASLFAGMYCHAMATLAMGEALGLSGDDRLRPPLERAIHYTLKSQNPNSGGWRYEPWRRQPTELGDTSQLGWQLMALRSAELAGIPMSVNAKQGIARFLKSVESGHYGGLASYRTGEQPTRAMTAEAMACRLFLGASPEQETIVEASEYLMKELPGGERTNLYYWYYATMGLFQTQGETWRRWNEALKPALLTAQRTDGKFAGSWDTGDLWGGHGGRVYTTAMGALCLEVYYRYLPLYGGRIAQRPGDKANR